MNGVLPIPQYGIELCKANLNRFAEMVAQTAAQADAEVYYHIMADALAWSDELPNVNTPDDFKEFKQIYVALLAMRIRVILTPGVHNFDPILEELRALAKDWAFFSPERHDASLSSKYLVLKTKGERELVTTLKRCLRKNQRKPNTNSCDGQM